MNWLNRKHKYTLTKSQELTIMMALFSQAQDYLTVGKISDDKPNNLHRIHVARITVDAYETIASQRKYGEYTATVIRGWRVRIAELQAVTDAKT